MKLRIKQDHLEYKEGDFPTGLNEDQQNYLVAMGVAEKVSGHTDSPALIQKEEKVQEALADKEARGKATEPGQKVAAEKHAANEVKQAPQKAAQEAKKATKTKK